MGLTPICVFGGLMGKSVFGWRFFVLFAILFNFIACSNDSEEQDTKIAEIAAKGDQQAAKDNTQDELLGSLADENAKLKKKLAEAEKKLKERDLQNEEGVRNALDEVAQAREALQKAATKEELAQAKQALVKAEEKLAAAIKQAGDKLEAKLKAQIQAYRERIAVLEQKLEEKRKARALANANHLSYLKGHTDVYNLEGVYKVMVIPVQFADKKFVDEDYLQNDLQGDLFDPNNRKSMRAYYRHASLGKFDVQGVVTAPVTVDGTLEKYGKATGKSSDADARGLVRDALLKLKETKTDESWWAQFDRWDLYDYDDDKNFYEPDGFIDAVILVYAGKSQASCQRSFDPDGKRPGSDDIPVDDPRRDAAVECFNRIWPHRWSLSIGADDPNYSKEGPVLEGVRRPSLNGLKISDNLFALDYNMQSEFSDLSTFMHEFGHSITLPDIYARQGDNGVGSWELMASNASNLAQELSSYSKIALGWVKPKVIAAKENASFYLGAYNFVSETQRDPEAEYQGPESISEIRPNSLGTDVSILSRTPEFNEPVYRSVVVLTPTTTELVKVADFPNYVGSKAAYTSRYDGQEKSMTKKIQVPTSGSAELSFDTIYHIETETNFASADKKIKIVTDYDIGEVKIDGELKESLRLISGDTDYDTLNDTNKQCEAARVLELRNKVYGKTANDAEKTEFKTKVAICHKPTWVKKKYDLSAYRGKEVELSIAYRTDAGYTEFGIVIDNIKMGELVVSDFENGAGFGDFIALTNGQYEQEYNQFYLMEYRDPSADYKVGGKELSYNMDSHIKVGSQSMFLDNGNLLESFRMLTMEYQPGLLVWYFNSKFDQNSNSPAYQDGKGYLLPVKPKLQEMEIPVVFDDSNFFVDGHYKDHEKDEEFKTFVDAQRNKLACFGYTRYFEYIKGKKPECGAFDSKFVNFMPNLLFGDKKLVYRREGFNDVLPKDRFGNWGVGVPFRMHSGIRTSLSTFRPETYEDFAPFKIYKEDDGKMVLDDSLTGLQKRYPAVAEFKDSSVALPKYKGFVEDSVVVEKVGFGFLVVEPEHQGLEGYKEDVSPNNNDHAFRRPRVKVLVDWEEVESVTGQATAPGSHPVASSGSHDHRRAIGGHSCNHDH